MLSIRSSTESCRKFSFLQQRKAAMASKQPNFTILLLLVYSALISCEGPDLIVVPDSASVEYGSSIIMSCVAAVDKVDNHPVISWRLNGDPIVSLNASLNESTTATSYISTSTKISKRGLTFEWSTIRVCSVDVREIGQYSCTATNSMGSVTETWSIDIRGGKQAELVIVPETQSVADYGSTITMACIAYGFPFPTITFSKDGTVVDSSDSNVVITHKTRTTENGTTFAQSMLVICSIEADNIGDYSCTTANGLGTNDTQTWSLTFFAPVELVVVPESQVVRFGSSVFMVCVAYGYPLPSVTFKAEKVDVYNSSRINVTENTITKSGYTFVQATLAICNAQASDAGEYTCNARNDQGNQTQSWDLVLSHVPEPAKLIEVPPKNQTIELGSTVVANCVGYGFPLPNITWIRNGIELSNSTSDRVSVYTDTIITKGGHLVHSILVIVDLTQSDAGAYNCTAENVIGKQSSEWQISIQSYSATTNPTTQATTESTTPNINVDPSAQGSTQVVRIGSGLGVFAIICLCLAVLVVGYLVYSKWRRNRMGCWVGRRRTATPNGYIYSASQPLPNTPLEQSLKHLVASSLNEVQDGANNHEKIYEPIDAIGLHEFHVNPHTADEEKGPLKDTTALTVLTSVATAEGKEDETSLVVENNGYVNIIPPPLKKHDAELADFDTIESPLPNITTATEYCTAVKQSTIPSSDSLEDLTPGINGDGAKTGEENTNYSVITLENLNLCRESSSVEPVCDTVISNKGVTDPDALQVPAVEDDYEPMKPGIL